MIALLAGTARRNVIELRRYAFNTFFEIVGIYVLFLIIFYGVRGVGGPRVRHGDALPAVVIGYVVFGLVFMSYSSLSTWMTQEANLGTLEQLAVSPYGLLAVLSAEYAPSVIRQAIVVCCITVAAEATTGQWLHLHVLTIASRDFAARPATRRRSGVSEPGSVVQADGCTDRPSSIRLRRARRRSAQPIRLASLLPRRAGERPHPPGRRGRYQPGTLATTISWFVDSARRRIPGRRSDRLSKRRCPGPDTRCAWSPLICRSACGAHVSPTAQGVNVESASLVTIRSEDRSQLRCVDTTTATVRQRRPHRPRLRHGSAVMLLARRGVIRDLLTRPASFDPPRRRAI